MSGREIKVGLAQSKRLIVKRPVITLIFSVILYSILLNIFVGCRSLDKTPNALDAEESVAPPNSVETSEAELIEDLEAARKTYVNSLERLIEYYTEIDNKLKLQWVREELEALYRPIHRPEPGPGHYKATDSIPAADTLFYEAHAMRRGIIDSDPKDILRRQL